jgi:hypothetical protein
MARANLAAVGFCLAAMLVVIAWMVPTVAGRPRSATFLAAAVVFFILGLAARQSEPPGSKGG